MGLWLSWLECLDGIEKVAGSSPARSTIGSNINWDEIRYCMDFEEYQKESRKMAIYPNQSKNYVYPILGLLGEVGEVGEVADKLKKVIRDDGGKLSEEKRKELKKELGDVL